MVWDGLKQSICVCLVAVCGLAPVTFIVGLVQPVQPWGWWCVGVCAVVPTVVSAYGGLCLAVRVETWFDNRKRARVLRRLRGHHGKGNPWRTG